MSVADNPVMARLAARYDLEEGHVPTSRQDRRAAAPGDYYKFHGKWIITKRGVAKIRAKEDAEKTPILHQQPIIQDVAGRVAVSGWWAWILPDELSAGFRTDTDPLLMARAVWTTGEADPKASAVEGTHPVAMAEKRWIVRGVLALVAPDGAGSIYGEEEFSADFWQRKQAQDQQPSQVAKPAQAPAKRAEESPDWAAKLPGEWNNICGDIAETTGVERGAFELNLLVHCTAFEGRDGNWIKPKQETFKALAEEKPKWALGAKNRAAEIGARLRAGEDVELTGVYWDEDERTTYTKTSMVLSGNAVEPTDDTVGQEDELDPDEVPF